MTAWKDFVVNLGKVHLKFLFKKDRYQVSIKGHSSIENFKLNDSQFNFKKSRYNKIYYVPVVGKGVLDIYYSDTCGRQIADKNTLRSVVVNVIAVNRYGQLIDNVHLRKKQSKKNLKLNPPGTYTNVIRADNKYDLSVPKEQTVSVELDSSTSLLTKFFYTESHLLQQRWCLFTADKSKTEAIRESFYTTFGLWLNCMPLAEINNYFATENLIIANKPSAEKYDTFQFHDEILLKQNGMKKALFFTEEKFNKWIKSLENAAQGTRRFI